MNGSQALYPERRSGVAMPAIRVTLVLSLLAHLAALWGFLPQLRMHLTERPDDAVASGTLVVQLAPPAARAPAPPPAPASKPRPAAPALEVPAPKAPAPRAVAPRAPPRPAREEIALNQAAPASPVVIPAPVKPPVAGDLSTYIEERRRARIESAPAPSKGGAPASAPVEDENARSERAVIANLGLNRKPTFGPDPGPGGGIFQIERMTFSDAEFLFFGWNKDIRRNTVQRIEVRKGDASDIRLAVVRRMIGIIREYEQEEFLWESRRLGRSVTLSARARDSAGLEEFLLREFFGDSRLSR